MKASACIVAQNNLFATECSPSVSRTAQDISLLRLTIKVRTFSLPCKLVEANAYLLPDIARDGDSACDLFDESLMDSKSFSEAATNIESSSSSLLKKD